MDDPVLVDDLRPSKPHPASVYDDMFESYFNRATEPSESSPKASSSSTPPPVFDNPVFDDDPDAVNPFHAIPLFEGGSRGGDAEEDFVGGLGRLEKSEGRREPEVAGFDDDLFPGLGCSARSTEPVRGTVEPDQEAVGFDDLIPGIGGSVKPALPVEPEKVVLDDGVIPRLVGSTHHHNSARDDPVTRQESEPMSSNKMSVSMPDDPFVILGATHTSEHSSFGLFSDYSDNIGMPDKSENTKVDAPAKTSGRFQGSDMFAGFTKAMPSVSFASEKEIDTTERRSVESINSISQSNHVLHGKPVQQGSAEATANVLPEMNVSEPSVIHEVPVVTGLRTLNPFDMDDGLPEEIKDSKMPDGVWLTVSDIILVTQPTSAPPPSRPPPPLATKKLPTESVTTKTYPHNHNQGSIGSAYGPKSSQIDELEDFFMAKPAKFANGHPWVLNHEGTEQYTSAGTASFRDQADSRDSKGMNQSFMGQADFGFVFTRSQYQQEQKDDYMEFCAQEMEKTDEDERLENERRQKEQKQRRAEREVEELEREREKVRQREQEEQKRHEKEREDRQAVGKAIREARERAGVEACMRAESEARQRAERAAVQKVAAEARERAAAEARERAAKAAAEAKERSAADARKRAAADAKDRAAAESRERAARVAAEAREKAAAESQEKAAAESRIKAERAAVEKVAAEARRRAERAAFERVAAEARQRAANEARERAAAEVRARENQQRTATTQPDLESFFGMPSRSSSVPKSQTTTMNPFDVHPQGSSGSGTSTVRRTSSGSASPFMQPSSSNLMDDLSSIFGAPSSSVVFQELDGESEERRKARLERHQRTIERAAKALAEKNERDLEAQREQEERHRIGETLDLEIKRWAAGKEGNLRALLSTLQYVLWPECGWRPVSLTDLITAASVKKEYRKATLCIHPDKVQQKGANLQQKYVAEKVFDLLKEAWNKFNSEELF